MFFFLETADGSPSLRLTRPDRETESMHSLRGAFSETDYIYGDAMRWVLEREPELKLLSVGLGLGYIEILAIAVASSLHRPVSIQSFEAVPELIQNFRIWCEDRTLPQDFQVAYDRIASMTAARYGLDKIDIKTELRQALSNGKITLHGALEASTQFSTRANCIAFDAFSSKTDPELWTPEFLNDFFAQAAAPTCVVSTYACTGHLKRSLKANGFSLSIRDGYASKRQSMFASRQS